MRATRAGLAAAAVVLAAACGRGTNTEAVFTEPPFTPEVTLAPTATPAGTTGSNTRLQFHTLVGQTVVFHVTGFQVGENVTFTVTKPDGTSFTGPARPVPQSGIVEGRYAPPLAGTYTVVAKGDRGSPEVTSQFIVSSSYTPPQTTTRPAATQRTFRTPAPTRRPAATPAPTRTPAATP